MAEVIWTKLAQFDLQDIYEYICKDSELYAIRLVDKIVERVEILKDYPETGKVVPELNDNSVRELIEGMYRIIDKKKGIEIVILRVYHGARLLKL